MISLPRFSISTESLPDVEDKINLRQLKQVAFVLEPRRVSNYTPSDEGGFVLYLRERLPVDETKLRAELPQFMASMRHYRQNETYGKWFGHQIDLAGPPFNRPPGKRGVNSGSDEAN